MTNKTRSILHWLAVVLMVVIATFPLAALIVALSGCAHQVSGQYGSVDSAQAVCPPAPPEVVQAPEAYGNPSLGMVSCDSNPKDPTHVCCLFMGMASNGFACGAVVCTIECSPWEVTYAKCSKIQFDLTEKKE